MIVGDKDTMYRMLAAGEFGNTIPQYFDYQEWIDNADLRLELWGVRSMVPGGPCRLYCPTNEVQETCRTIGDRYNISPMIDNRYSITLWAEVWESPSGLVAYGIEYPRGSWRKLMPTEGEQWEGITARAMLRKHLNANSLEDLRELLDKYPSHVVELSVAEECFGTVPHRNHIVWEVRGTY